ncbi:MAG: Gfo/Idh/MocA family protein [Anaerolineae bacterium]|jgi:predicted dehydrogenase
METLALGIVGCGGMGGRHLLGLKALAESGLNNVTLAAVCDLRRENAEALADDAAELLGYRPAAYGDLETMIRHQPEIRAVDVTTDVGAHHRVAVPAFELGLHVLCEKPLAVTMRAANRILAAADQAGRLLSVAENYRRDPICRLNKALIDAGAIGQPRMLFDISVGGGNRIIILPWRHDRNVGGILLDAGVHNADLMQYYLGPVRQVYARTRRWEPIRYRDDSSGNLTGFYARWAASIPDQIEATAEDSIIALMDFESGAQGQWTSCYGARGQGFGQGGIYGSEGSLRPGGARSGRSPILRRDGGDEVSGDDLLSLVPDHRLDELTARLFGGERLASYDVPFPVADRSLLAIELHEFAECVLHGRQPEVAGGEGRQALALCYAALESGLLDQPVRLNEVISGTAASYEADINAHWGLT